MQHGSLPTLEPASRSEMAAKQGLYSRADLGLFASPFGCVVLPMGGVSPKDDPSRVIRYTDTQGYFGSEILKRGCL